MDAAADLTAGAVTAAIAYTDRVQAQTLVTSAMALTTLGAFIQTSWFIQAKSGTTISYSTSHTGILGSASYDIYLAVERLS